MSNVKQGKQGIGTQDLVITSQTLPLSYYNIHGALKTMEHISNASYIPCSSATLQTEMSYEFIYNDEMPHGHMVLDFVLGCGYWESCIYIVDSKF